MAPVKRTPARPSGRAATAALSATAAACLLLSACGSGDTPDAAAAEPTVGKSASALYKEAKANKETVVNVYGSQQTACYGDFEKKYPGIKVKFTYLVANLDQKVEQEHLADKVLGDVVWTGSKSMLQINEAGNFERFKPSTAALPKAGAAPNGGFVLLTEHPTGGYLYNKDAMSAAEAPKTWDDFVKPGLKGKVVAPNPSLGGTGTSLFMELALSGGDTDESWMKKFAANDPVLVENQASGMQSVKSGEYPILLGGVSPAVADRETKADPRLGYVPFVKGATPVVGTYAGVTSKAPHPNAARLLLTWMSGKEGQTCMVEKDLEYAASTDSSVPVPKGLPALSEVRTAELREMNDEELARLAEYSSEFKDIFGS